MLFVWVAGIELDLKQAWVQRRETEVTAGLALGMPLLFGCVAALSMLSLGHGWAGPKGATWQVVVGIGMACAVTALPILVLFMEKLEILRQPLGQRILRYASLDDIAIWGVLALILLDWNRVGRQLGFLIAFSVVAWGVRKLMRRLPAKDRWYIGLIWLAGAGFAADWSGLHFMVGAFLSGAVLAADLFDQEETDFFRNKILLAIMPVFFLDGIAYGLEHRRRRCVQCSGGIASGVGRRQTSGGSLRRQDPQMGEGRSLDHRLAVADQGPDHDHFR